MTDKEYAAALKIVSVVGGQIDGMIVAGQVDPHLVSVFRDLTGALSDLVDAELALITAKLAGPSTGA